MLLAMILLMLLTVVVLLRRTSLSGLLVMVDNDDGRIILGNLSDGKLTNLLLLLVGDSEGTKG